VTCFVPPDLVIVPRSAGTALPDAVTEPVVVTGGQVLAHDPVHMDWSLASLTHMYTARPDPLVRNAPPELDLVEITAAEPVDDALAAAAPADVAVAAGVLLLLLVPDEQAAASSATPMAAPNRTGTGVRRNNESLIAFRLPPARAVLHWLRRCYRGGFSYRL
jgi:hypothetical protein